jgi:hypothetical protein
MDFYVIMPMYSDPSAKEKIVIIRKVANSRNFIAHFPEYKNEKQSFSIDSIMNKIKGCSFVLADLSLERPSCYYELGIVESIKIPVYLIAKSGTDIHQTAKRDQVLFFQNFEELEKILTYIFDNIDIPSSKI